MKILDFFILLTTVLSYSLSHRYQKLQSISTPITYSSSLYNVLTETPRNYTLFILLTTSDPAHNCQACKTFAAEYNLLKSVVTPALALTFGTLEYRDGTDVFQRLGVNNVPMLLRYGPSAGVGKTDGDYDTYDLGVRGVQAENLATYINEIYGTKVKLLLI